MLEGRASTLLARLSDPGSILSAAKDVPMPQPALTLPRACALLLALLCATPAHAQVVAPPMVNAPAPGAGAFGSGLSGPAPVLGPAPQAQAPTLPPRAQNLDIYGVPFTQVQPGGLPYTPPYTGGPRLR